jgi:hypothetical protein
MLTNDFTVFVADGDQFGAIRRLQPRDVVFERLLAKSDHAGAQFHRPPFPAVTQSDERYRLRCRQRRHVTVDPSATRPAENG